MAKEQKTRVLLVEDHPIFREGVHLALTFSKLNCEIVAEVPNVQQAVDYIQRHPNGIDIALLDFFLPDGNGRDIVKVLKSKCPKAKILLITGEVDNLEVRKTAREGIEGVISKDIASSALTAIVGEIINANAKTRESETKQKDISLTEREVDIIKLCVKGMNAKEIAETLTISPRTVEHHKERIFKKIGSNSAMELMKFAMQKGLV